MNQNWFSGLAALVSLIGLGLAERGKRRVKKLEQSVNPFIGLTVGARDAFKNAMSEARLTGHASVTPDHVLLAIASQAECDEGRALLSLGFDPDALRRQVKGRRAPIAEAQDVPFEPRTIKLMVSAMHIADSSGVDDADVEHVISAILAQRKDKGARTLIAAGIDDARLRRAQKRVS